MLFRALSLIYHSPALECILPAGPKVPHAHAAVVVDELNVALHEEHDTFSVVGVLAGLGGEQVGAFRVALHLKISILHSI